MIMSQVVTRTVERDSTYKLTMDRESVVEIPITHMERRDD